MNITGKFEKVSKDIFVKALLDSGYEKFAIDAPAPPIAVTAVAGAAEDIDTVGTAAGTVPAARQAAAEAVYESIKLPRRATKGSAGYDIYAPFGFLLSPGETIMIPTGIRVRISEGWMLAVFPRSGLGFKFRFQLNNTVGIIDSDYYYADNEGHIMCRMTNDSNEDKVISLEQGQAFVQGIFMPFGITEDDDADGVRTGGFGSTG